MRYGVGFIPSYMKGTQNLTEISPFLCDLNKIEIIAGKQYVVDEKGFSHLLQPFTEIEDTKFDSNSIDCRSKLFDDREDAIKHINRIMRLWFKTPKNIDYFEFDDGVWGE